mmetsp:Transcript_15977/g.45854  ORF Transcript_15977/g.45854 Transcript_15977/m.45854 type:complete len:102 (+) Transcript_15977:1679-1984(+)
MYPQGKRRGHEPRYYRKVCGVGQSLLPAAFLFHDIPTSISSNSTCRDVTIAAIPSVPPKSQTKSLPRQEQGGAQEQIQRHVALPKGVRRDEAFGNDVEDEA